MSSTPGHERGNHTWGVESSTGPDELEAPPMLRASRFPRWALVLFGLFATLLVVGGAGYAAYHYNATRPQAVVTASAPHTPWAMVPPLRVGDYSRDVNAEATPTPNATTHTQTVTATYSKAGQSGFVLFMSRPETNAKSFVTEMGMTSVIPTGDGYCGTSVDTNRDGCAVVRDNTAILVVDLSGLTRADLVAQADAFGTTLSGH